MNTNLITRHAGKLSLAVLSVACMAVLSTPAQAEEGVTPLQPGITTGVPVGALPPPGVYLSVDFTNITAQYLETGGEHLPIKLSFPLISPLLTWSTGKKILGANYAVGIAQPYGWIGVDTTRLGGPKTVGTGPFNTILMPYILSWNLGKGWFVGTGMSVCLPDGNHQTVDGVRSPRSWANNFWTLEPNLAFSYLGGGWNITFNNVVDFNGKNTDTGYHSGDMYYLEFTGTKHFGKWTAGIVANYAQQINDDHLHGVIVGNGNRVQHIMAGPYVAYDFGKFSLAFKYSQDLRTRNDLNISAAHLILSTRL